MKRRALIHEVCYQVALANLWGQTLITSAALAGLSWRRTRRAAWLSFCLSSGRFLEQRGGPLVTLASYIAGVVAIHYKLLKYKRIRKRQKREQLSRTLLPLGYEWAQSVFFVAIFG